MGKRVVVTEMTARVGMKVIIASDSPYSHQQSDHPYGTIMQITGDGWCRVRFSDKSINSYRIGFHVSSLYPGGKVIDGKTYDLLTYEEFGEETEVKNTLVGLIIKP